MNFVRYINQFALAGLLSFGSHAIAAVIPVQTPVYENTEQEPYKPYGTYDETIIKEQELDGTKITTYSDGSSITKTADGTQLMKNADGSSVLIKANGDQVVTGEDGSYEEIYADGSHKIKNKNGSSAEDNPNGTVTILRSDLTTVKPENVTAWPYNSWPDH